MGPSLAESDLKGALPSRNGVNGHPQIPGSGGSAKQSAVRCGAVSVVHGDGDDGGDDVEAAQTSSDKSESNGPRLQTFSFVDISVRVANQNVSKVRKERGLGRLFFRQNGKGKSRATPTADVSFSRSSSFSSSSSPSPTPLSILDGVSGELRRGQMLALMGPSGSGKTSLLNALAQRLPFRQVMGEIYVNGLPLKRKAIKRSLGFVFQDDLMLWNLTARETILFAAKLRLPESVPLAVKEARVDSILEKLGIMNVKDSIIGKEGRRGVSGGERKRVAVAIELVTSPQLLFLDEPTSGLDAASALSLVTLLRELAEEGMMVISSIHQPRQKIFNQFHSILLLSKGKTAYYGPSEAVVPYFEGLGLTLPPQTAPADWILDIMASTAPLSVGKSLVDAYSEFRDSDGDVSRRALGLPTELSLRDDASNRDFGDLNDKDRYATGFLYQLRVLMQRQQLKSRGEVFDLVNAGQIATVAVIASAVWWQSQAVADIVGVFFFVTIQQSFTALNATIRVFPSERALMMRERSTASYRVGPYFLAKCFSDFYLLIILPFLYGTVIYWAVGLRASIGAFVLFQVLFLSAILTAQSMGMLLSALVPDFATASSLSFVLVLLLMLFGGFYVDNERIPTGLQWFKYCSFVFWAYGAMLENEFSGTTVDCESSQNTDWLAGYECPISGEVVLSIMGFPDANVAYSILVMWGMTFIFRAGTYYTLRRSTRVGGGK